MQSSPIPDTPSDRDGGGSPAPDMEMFEDEGALLGDLSQQEDEEEGEELFGDNMEK